MARNHHRVGYADAAYEKRHTPETGQQAEEGPIALALGRQGVGGACFTFDWSPAAVPCTV